MNNRKSILLLAPNDFKYIPTLNRHIEALSGQFNVFAAGYGPPWDESIPFTKITRTIESETTLTDKILRNLRLWYYRKAGKHEKNFWLNFRIDQEKQLRHLNFDLIIVQHIFFLPIARLISGKSTKIIFDAQEYYPGEYSNDSEEGNQLMPMIDMICKKYFPMCSGMISYCDEVRKMYQDNYGIHSEVITTASRFVEQTPSKVDPADIKIIHHGIAVPERKLELILDLADLLDDRFSIHLMLTRTATPYYRSLAEKAKSKKKVFMLEPVSPRQIVAESNKYDIGLMMIPPDNINYMYMCPNKFWEFIQARLCVAFWPYPVIKRLVNQYELGITPDGFTVESMAEKLNALTTEQIAEYKANSHKNAMLLSAETEKPKILKLVNEILF